MEAKKPQNSNRISMAISVLNKNLLLHQVFSNPLVQAVTVSPDNSEV